MTEQEYEALEGSTWEQRWRGSLADEAELAPIVSYHVWREVAPDAACSYPRGLTVTDHSSDGLRTAERMAEQFNACCHVAGVRYYVRQLDEMHPAYWAQDESHEAPCWSDPDRGRPGHHARGAPSDGAFNGCQASYSRRLLADSRVTTLTLQPQCVDLSIPPRNAPTTPAPREAAPCICGHPQIKHDQHFLPGCTRCHCQRYQSREAAQRADADQWHCDACGQDVATWGDQPCPECHAFRGTQRAENAANPPPRRPRGRPRKLPAQLPANPLTA